MLYSDGERETYAKADGSNSAALAENHSNYIRWQRANRYAHADLATPALQTISQGSIEPCRH